MTVGSVTTVVVKMTVVLGIAEDVEVELLRLVEETALEVVVRDREMDVVEADSEVLDVVTEVRLVLIPLEVDVVVEAPTPPMILLLEVVDVGSWVIVTGTLTVTV